MNKDIKNYQCPVCKLHYRDLKTAKLCEAYCRKHQACSIDITKHSIEASK